MAFRDYLDKLNLLDSIELLVINSNGYLPERDKKLAIEYLNELRREYEIAMMKDGDYPTI